MTLPEIERFLRDLGAPADQVADMARQLDKRARQMSEEKQQSFAASLAYLVALMKQGWAGQKQTLQSPASGEGSIRKWQVMKAHPPQDFRIFKAQWRRAVSPRTNQEHEVLVLSGANWVNVVALTRQKEVVLIEQYRHGIEEITLEIPGGMIDPDEPPLEAGARELREETGYVGDEIELIGTAHPNPAFQSNLIHTVLVKDVRPTGFTHFDSGEDIAVHLASLAQIPELIRQGKITHSLVILAFYWLELKNKDQ